MKTLQFLLGAALIHLSLELAVDWNISPWSVKNPFQEGQHEKIDAASKDFEYEYIYDTLDETDTASSIDFVGQEFEDDFPRAEALRMNTDKKYILRKILRKRKAATESYYQQETGKVSKKTKKVIKGTARDIVKSFLESMRKNKTENGMFNQFPSDGNPNVMIEDLTTESKPENSRIPRKVEHLQNIQKLFNDRVLSSKNKNESDIEMLPTLPPPIHRKIEKSQCSKSLKKIQQFINETKIKEDTILDILCKTFPMASKKICKKNVEPFFSRKFKTSSPQRRRIVLKKGPPKMTQRLRDYKHKPSVPKMVIFNPKSDFRMKAPIFRKETDDWKPIF